MGKLLFFVCVLLKTAKHNNDSFIFRYRKLSNKYLARLYLPQSALIILANLHDLVRGYTHDERLADQLNKSIRKVLIKLHVINRNRMFGEHELQLFYKFQEGIQSLIKTIVQLYENYTVLKKLSFIRSCEKCQQLLHEIISSRQTRKSHDLIDSIFNRLSDADFIKYVFDSKSSFNHGLVKDMITHIGLLMDQELI